MKTDMTAKEMAKPVAHIMKSGASQTSAVRRPGRPAGGASGTEQRCRLLDTALTLFARQGILNTTLGDIAREAGMTPAMVHYYFKTREQLIDIVIDERFLPLRAAIGGVFEANASDPVAAITQLAQRLVDVATEHPWFAPLWVRDVVSEGGILKQRMHERFGDAHQKALGRRIAKWQEAGQLNADLEPSLVIPALLGLTLLPLAFAKIWRNDPARRRIGAEEIARHAVALLTHGVGPRAGRP
jgi:AcrR family transcriptional regulator